VTRRTAFVLCLIVLFGYEAYALFVRGAGTTAHEPRANERHLTLEVNANTPLSQTFVMHADELSGVEIFARPSDQPAVGPLEVTVSREIGAEWTRITRASLDVARLDLSGTGSVMVTTPRVASSAGATFRVDVAMPQTPRGHGLRFEAGGPTYVQGVMEMGGRQAWGDLKFRTVARRTTVFDNIRHIRRAWPPVLQNDVVWILILVIVNWALATVIYYLAFAPEEAPEERSEEDGSGRALTTADQPRV
jgi:hypothetical protein